MRTPKQEALDLAVLMTERTGRKHVVRDDYGTYRVVPFYAPDRCGRDTNRHDSGYTAYGVLVAESL